MPVTLEEAKVGMTNKVDQAIIDKFQRASAILNALTFDNVVSPGTNGSTMGYSYKQLKTPSMAEGRKINSEYTAGEAKTELKHAVVKISGGAFEVDRVLENTAAQSEISFQLDQKTTAVINKFHNDFINGNTTTDEKDFDGLNVLITGASTECKPAVIDLTTQAKIKLASEGLVFEIDLWLATMQGKPQMLLMNSRMKTILSAVARAMKYYTPSINSFGETVDNYNGIPLVDMGDYYNGTKTTPVVHIEDDGTTSIYAVQFDLSAVHGISPTGDKVIKTYLPDMKAPGAVKKGEVELLAGIVVKNSLKAGVFRNLKIQNPPAQNAGKTQEVNSGSQPKPISKMLKADLIEYAQLNNIAIDSNATVDVIKATILEAEAQNTAGQ